MKDSVNHKWQKDQKNSSELNKLQYKTLARWFCENTPQTLLHLQTPRLILEP
jgi:hypothetical protein